MEAISTSFSFTVPFILRRLQLPEQTLSGHFHGGTIRLPILGGLMTPQLQFFVRECAGEFSEGSTRMIVNRGLGTHSVRIRLNDRPEISVIDVIPKGDSIAEPERD